MQAYATSDETRHHAEAFEAELNDTAAISLGVGFSHFLSHHGNVSSANTSTPINSANLTAHCRLSAADDYHGCDLRRGSQPWGNPWCRHSYLVGKLYRQQSNRQNHSAIWQGWWSENSSPAKPYSFENWEAIGMASEGYSSYSSTSGTSKSFHWFIASAKWFPKGHDAQYQADIYAALTPKNVSLQIYMCRSGSAADTQNLCSYVQYYLHQHCMSLGRDADVKTAAKLAQLIAYNNKVWLPSFESQVLLLGHCLDMPWHSTLW